MTSLKKFLKKKKYTQVSLKFTQTNHFEITAHINGIKGRFILDTGASNTCVATDKIEQFKLSCTNSEIKAAGAGATDMETQISKKNKLTIGKWKKNKTSIVIFDLKHVNEALTAHNVQPVDGIIGADILQKANGIIDYKTNTLYLKK